jgi:hypothetical protein
MTTTIAPIASDRTEIQMVSAVPTFLVEDVGATARWYAEHLGFQTAGAFPDSEPYAYASLRRDGEDMTPQELAELEAHVEAMGHKYYGIFADNSGAMKVFDEIELVRDLNTIRGDRSIVKDLRYA